MFIYSDCIGCSIGPAGDGTVCLRPEERRWNMTSSCVASNIHIQWTSSAFLQNRKKQILIFPFLVQLLTAAAFMSDTINFSNVIRRYMLTPISRKHKRFYVVSVMQCAHFKERQDSNSDVLWLYAVHFKRNFSVRASAVFLSFPQVLLFYLQEQWEPLLCSAVCSSLYLWRHLLLLLTPAHAKFSLVVSVMSSPSVARAFTPGVFE